MRRILLGATIIITTAFFMACSDKIVNTDGDNQSENKEVIEDESEDSKSSIKSEDEEAIQKLLEDFTEASKEKNFDAIKPYFAIDEYIESYNMDIANEKFGGNVEKPTYEEISYEVIGQYSRYLLGFSATDTMTSNSGGDMDYAGISDMIMQLDLKELKMDRVDIPLKEYSETEKYDQMIKENCELYGAEDIQYRSVLYDLAGETYYCGFTLYKYDGAWKIYSLNCPINANVDIDTVIMPCTEEVYLKTIKG